MMIHSESFRFLYQEVMAFLKILFLHDCLKRTDLKGVAL